MLGSLALQHRVDVALAQPVLRCGSVERAAAETGLGWAGPGTARSALIATLTPWAWQTVQEAGLNAPEHW